VLAIPAFFALNRLGLVNLWSTLVAGLVIGGIMGAFTEQPQTGWDAFIHAGVADHAVRRICALATIGAISALVFWFVRTEIPVRTT
jgi:hypothetical protein